MNERANDRESFKLRIEEEFRAREAKALAMGGPDKLAKRAKPGILDARQRIDRLMDAGTFTESGLFTASMHSPEDAERSPGDGKLTGYGKVEGRWTGVVSNDFTVFGASSAATNVRKIAHMKRTCTQRGMPMVFFGESSGARMPDTMGARGMGLGLGSDPTQYQRMRVRQWAAAVLGM